jgi:hypothetical protein
MKKMVAPTLRVCPEQGEGSEGAELKLSATTRHQPAKVSQAGPKSWETFLASAGQQVRSRKRKRKMILQK